MIDKSKLWTPTRGAVSSHRKEIWCRNRSISFHGFPEWPLPENHTWHEDPFQNRTWRLWYHCLTWLYVPAELVERDADASHLGDIRRLSLDWMTVHGDPASAASNDMAWDDHAIAYRSTCLVYLYRRIFSNDKAWCEECRHAMTVHLHALHGFLNKPKYRGHNHGIFHCFAILNMISGVPELSVPEKFKTDAETRLFELVNEMIDIQEGATKEQALEYHYIAMELVFQIIEYASFFVLTNKDNRIADLHSLMTRMVDFAVVMRWPDGSVPSVGDTLLYWNGWSRPVLDIIEKYVSAGYGSESTIKSISPNRHLKKDSESQSHEETSLYFYPRSGYIMSKGGGSDAYAIFMKAGPAVHSHGHSDHLSIQLFLGKDLIMVDSGGPYKYGDKKREYFLHPRAHNVVACSGQDAFEYGVSEGDVSSLTCITHSHLGGSRTLTDGLRHTRNALFLCASRTLLVHDNLEVQGAFIERKILQFWHFAPGFILKKMGSISSHNCNTMCFALTSPSGRSFCAFLMSRRNFEVTLIEGRVSPQLQGWVNRNVAVMDPAPVIEVAFEMSDNVSAETIFSLYPDDGIDRSALIFDSHQPDLKSIIYNEGLDNWDFRFCKHRLVHAAHDGNGVNSNG